MIDTNVPVSQAQDLINLAREASRFLGTDYGKYVLNQLSLMYNAEHHAAEDSVTAEVKAAHVDTAAGLRKAIELLTRDAELEQAGYFNKEASPPSS